MKKGKTFLQIVVVGLCLVLAGGDLFAQTRIEAQGAATIHNNMVDVARDKAIDNAQREAVEKAVGVMVSSFTEVENYQVKMDHRYCPSPMGSSIRRTRSLMKRERATSTVLR